MDSSEKIDLHAEPASKPKRWTAHWLALGIGGLPALATVLAFGGQWYWQLDLLSHFRVQYAVVLAIMVVLAMFLRHWRLALFVMIPLAINVGVILPLYVHPKWLAPQPEFINHLEMGQPLQVMSYSMAGMFGQGDEPLEMIRNSGADVIVLQDVRPDMLQKLEFAVAPFRVFMADARNDGYGVAILMRVSIRPQLVIKDAKLIELTSRDNAKGPFALEAQLRWQGRPITLLTFISASPLSRHAQPTQDQQFQGVSQWVKRQHHPVIVMGNFKTSPWSHNFAQLLEESGLHNSQLGYGVQGSWPSTGGALGQIPVDHCLLSPSFTAINRELGPSYTSNHHAVTVTLQWAGGAQDIATVFASDIDEDETGARSRTRMWRRFQHMHGMRPHHRQYPSDQQDTEQAPADPPAATTDPAPAPAATPAPAPAPIPPAEKPAPKKPAAAKTPAATKAPAAEKQPAASKAPAAKPAPATAPAPAPSPTPPAPTTKPAE